MTAHQKLAPRMHHLQHVSDDYFYQSPLVSLENNHFIILLVLFVCLQLTNYCCVLGDLTIICYIVLSDNACSISFVALCKLAYS